MRGILVAHSSALCHPADMCYICMAAGDPWIKCLQDYCHISFNNIIILRGKRCFMPDASCLVSPPLSLSSYLSLFAFRLCLILLACLHLPLGFFSPKLSIFWWGAMQLGVLGNLSLQDINVYVEHCRSSYLPDVYFFPLSFFLQGCFNKDIGPTNTKIWATSKQEPKGLMCRENCIWAHRDNVFRPVILYWPCFAANKETQQSLEEMHTSGFFWPI